MLQRHKRQQRKQFSRSHIWTMQNSRPTLAHKRWQNSMPISLLRSQVFVVDVVSREWERVEHKWSFSLFLSQIPKIILTVPLYANTSVRYWNHCSQRNQYVRSNIHEMTENETNGKKQLCKKRCTGVFIAYAHVHKYIKHCKWFGTSWVFSFFDGHRGAIFAEQLHCVYFCASTRRHKASDGYALARWPIAEYDPYRCTFLSNCCKAIHRLCGSRQRPFVWHTKKKSTNDLFDS